MFKKDKNLMIIALIAVVNALGYGIIIPVLYSYSQKYGLSDFDNGLLFSIFSICQFISTPFIGHFSDLYGRKPLLLISLMGTALSFVMMAFAPSAIFLFLARALDGITAGNIPVASAVISDTTEPQDRAKGFGIIGAAFGLGFIFGPAISAFTTPLGAAVPFLIAAAVTIVAVIMTWLILPETNKHKGQVAHGKLFDFVKLAKAVVDVRVGTTLLISFIYFLAFGLFIYSFQPVTNKILHLSAQENSLIFTLYGIVGFVSQLVIIPKITKRFGERKSLQWSLISLVAIFVGFFLMRSILVLVLISIAMGIANAFVQPLIQTLLSKEVDMKSQGEIQGVNASYVSLGFIFGPILGGLIATVFIPLPFLVGSLAILGCAYLSFRLPKPVPAVHLQ